MRLSKAIAKAKEVCVGRPELIGKYTNREGACCALGAFDIAFPQTCHFDAHMRLRSPVLLDGQYDKVATVNDTQGRDAAFELLSQYCAELGDPDVDLQERP